jgi:hypothetical protein
LEIAFIGLEKEGTETSSKSLVKMDRKSFDKKRNPPSLISLVIAPENISIGRCISLY